MTGVAEPFATVLEAGGHANSLGRSGEVVAVVLADRSQLDELYACLFDDDAWVRMRAADALEKVCREHPRWFRPYLPRLLEEMARIEQPTVQWHLAQMLGEIELTDAETRRAIEILTGFLERSDVDWIVAANAMRTLALFWERGDLDRGELDRLLDRQLSHRSKSVVRLASRLLASERA